LLAQSMAVLRPSTISRPPTSPRTNRMGKGKTTEPHKEDHDDGYEVGYGRPPRHSRFRLGQSGNPAGRRKGIRNLKTDVMRTLKTPIKVKEAGRSKTRSTQEGLLWCCGRRPSEAMRAPSTDCLSCTAVQLRAQRDRSRRGIGRRRPSHSRRLRGRGRRRRRNPDVYSVR
jgi:hypothetical protein